VVKGQVPLCVSFNMASPYKLNLHNHMYKMYEGNKDDIWEPLSKWLLSTATTVSELFQMI